jgi:sugar lactone lactonase YvrE
MTVRGLSSKNIVFTLLLVGVTVCASGCNSQHGMVMMIDESYEPAIEVASDSGIASPDGLLFRDGQLLMADEGGSAVRVWSQSAASLKTLCDREDGISSPEDLVVDGDGNIFFTDDDVGGVWHIDPDGVCRLLAGKDDGLVETEAIALTSTGDILVGDGATHLVFRVTPQGEVAVFLGPEFGINKPESFAFDESGKLFIADNRDDVLYEWSSSAGLQPLISNQPGFSPESIWYQQGVLYITNSNSGKIYQYSRTTGLKTIAVLAGFGPIQGITTDEQGNIYVSVQSDLKRGVGYIVRLKKARK